MRTLVSLAILSIAAPVAWAQQNQVVPCRADWDKDGPVTGNKSVSSRGTVKADEGWKPVVAVLKVVPVAGGKLSQDESKEFKDGKWGPLTAKDLPAGQYVVWVVVTFRHETKGDKDYATAVNTVTVP
jgi:hypothetical protein